MDLKGEIERVTRESQRLFAELVAGERRLRSLARAVWRVEEDERRRLARELHDGLGQTLTALKIHLELLRGRAEGESPELGEKLSESIAIAAGALGEARRLARLLRPQVLDDLGLGPALAWLARSLEQWTGLRVELQIDGCPSGERLDPDLETLVFRLAQEGLNNVLKHAGVDRARVEVEHRGELLAVAVVDQGCGFDPAQLCSTGTGSGLSGLGDRVRVFGGRFRLDSSPGGGTRLEALLPIPGGEREGAP